MHEDWIAKAYADMDRLDGPGTIAPIVVPSVMLALIVCCIMWLIGVPLC